MRNPLTLIALAVALIALCAGPALADTTSGTVTVTESPTRNGQAVVHWDWTSDASGNVVDNSAVVEGEITRVIFNPDTGTTSPTANYDVEIRDTDGRDLLYGNGDNRSASASEGLCFGAMALSSAFTTATLSQTVDTNATFVPWRPRAWGRLDLRITNAGNANGGEIRLYLDVD